MRISVGTLLIDDLDRTSVLESCLTHLATPEVSVVLALHVTAVNARYNREFAEALVAADLIYADGNSALLAARAWGARALERFVTTDLFAEICHQAPLAKIAIIGGDPGVALLASERLRHAGVNVVYATDGFRRDDNFLLQELTASAPNLVLVGLGMPLEANWLACHRDRLPAAMYMTCGGMIRLLADVERRAPKQLQSLKLEWLFRLVKDPKRTYQRYLFGVWNMACLVLGGLLKRIGLGGDERKS